MCFDTVGRVLTVADAQARVAFDGTARTVSLVLLQADDVAVRPGDWVRSHTGLAVERLDPAAAAAEIAEAQGVRGGGDADAHDLNLRGSGEHDHDLRGSGGADHDHDPRESEDAS